MPQLINIANQQLEDVPHEAVGQKFLSGQYNLPSNEPVNLLDPSGKLVSVSPTEVLPSIKQGGYTFPTSKAIQDYKDQQEYGSGIGNMAKAAALGAGETGTFGLSNLALKALGVNPETIKKIEKYNPGSHIAGQVGGVVGSLALAPELSPVGLAAKSGAALTEGAAPIIGNAIANKTASAILSKVGSKAIGGAFEGALYGGGNVLSEAALGDPHEVAQKAWSQIGMSALLGGALSGTLATGEVLAPKAVEAAQGAAGKVRDLLSGTEDSPSLLVKGLAKGSSFVSGKPEESIISAFYNRGKAMLPEERAALSSDFVDSLSNQYTKMNAAIDKASKDVAPQLANEMLGASQGEIPLQKALSAYDLAKAPFESKFMTKSGDSFAINPTKVGTFLKQVGSDTGAEKLGILHNFNTATKDALDAIGDAYGSVPDMAFDKGALQSLLEKTQGLQSAAAKEAGIQKTISAIGGAGAGDGENLASAGALALGASHFLGVPGAITAPAVATYEALKYPFLTMQRLSKLEGLVNKATTSIGSNTAAIFRVATPAASKAAPLIASQLSAGHGDTKEDREATYEKTVNKIQKLNADPQHFMQVMNDATTSIHPHAPNVSGAIQMAAASAVNFLDSKVPRQLNPMPLSPEYKPSQAEQARFMHYYDVVDNPIVALREVKDGTLTKDTTEALQAVHPQLYDTMKQGILDKLAENKDSIPYQTSVSLSQFLGQPLTESMLPQSIIATQLAYQAPQKSNQGQGMPQRGHGLSGLSKLNASNRAMTSMQSVESRRKL